MKLIITFIAALFLVSCTSTGGVSLLKTAETGVHVKLLDAEFDQAVAALRATPFTEAELSQVEPAIASLQVQKEFLNELRKQNAGEIALAAARAQSILNSVEADVRTIRVAYESYLANNPNAVADQLLVSYRDSAVIARDNIQEGIDSGNSVTAGQLAQYFGLALRTFAAVNGVPVL